MCCLSFLSLFVRQVLLSFLFLQISKKIIFHVKLVVHVIYVQPSWIHLIGELFVSFKHATVGSNQQKRLYDVIIYLFIFNK